MKYIALLRGINVGKSVQVKMKELIDLFETKKYKNVKTYINSGNVCFKSDENKHKIKEEIEFSLY